MSECWFARPDPGFLCETQADTFANSVTGYSFIKQLANTANGTSATVFKKNNWKTTGDRPRFRLPFWKPWSVPNYSWTDERKAYGETRLVALAPIDDRLFCCVYVERDGQRRIISLRKANKREVTDYASND